VVGLSGAEGWPGTPMVIHLAMIAYSCEPPSCETYELLNLKYYILYKFLNNIRFDTY